MSSLLSCHELTLISINFAPHADQQYEKYTYVLEFSNMRWGGAEIHGFVWPNQIMWPTAGNNFHFMKCDIAKNRTQDAAMPAV
jgi:hypothetical protein